MITIYFSLNKCKYHTKPQVMIKLWHGTFHSIWFHYISINFMVHFISCDKVVLLGLIYHRALSPGDRLPKVTYQKIALPPASNRPCMHFLTVYAMVAVHLTVKTSTLFKFTRFDIYEKLINSHFHCTFVFWNSATGCTNGRKCTHSRKTGGSDICGGLDECNVIKYSQGSLPQHWRMLEVWV